VRVPVSGPRFRQGSKLRLGVYDALDDAEQVEGAAARQPGNPRHRHNVAGGKLAEHTEKLAPVGCMLALLFSTTTSS